MALAFVPPDDVEAKFQELVNSAECIHLCGIYPEYHRFWEYLWETYVAPNPPARFEKGKYAMLENIDSPQIKDPLA